jgi:hypothetical protein
MYKVEINIADWDFVEDEVVLIETSDFDKAQIIQEFIDMQKEGGWAVDYQPIEYVDVDEDGLVYDEDYDVWCMCDEDTDVWYWYDEESDEWVEVEEDESEEDESEEDESEEDESEEDEDSAVATYVVVQLDN